MSLQSRTNQFTIQETLDQVCHLVATDDSVRAVYLVCPERPTILEIDAGCDLAQAASVDFSVLPDGTLEIRERRIAEARATKAHWRPHLPNWSFGFPNLEEGTR